MCSSAILILCLVSFSFTSISSRGRREANKSKANGSAPSCLRANISKSLDSLTVVDRNYITTIEVDESNGRPGTIQDDNEAVYGVVKIQVKKPQIDAPPTEAKRSSIVQINSQKLVAPYCCTGKDMKANEIRIVVNQR